MYEIIFIIFFFQGIINYSVNIKHAGLKPIAVSMASVGLLITAYILYYRYKLLQSSDVNMELGGSSNEKLYINETLDNSPPDKTIPSAPLSQPIPSAPLSQLDYSAPLSQLDSSVPLSQLDSSAPLSQLDSSAPLYKTIPSAPLYKTIPSAPLSQLDSSAP